MEKGQWALGPNFPGVCYSWGLVVVSDGQFPSLA